MTNDDLETRLRSVLRQHGGDVADARDPSRLAGRAITAGRRRRRLRTTAITSTAVVAAAAGSFIAGTLAGTTPTYTASAPPTGVVSSAPATASRGTGGFRLGTVKPGADWPPFAIKKTLWVGGVPRDLPIQVDAIYTAGRTILVEGVDGLFRVDGDRVTRLGFRPSRGLSLLSPDGKLARVGVPPVDAIGHKDWYAVDVATGKRVDVPDSRFAPHFEGWVPDHLPPHTGAGETWSQGFRFTIDHTSLTARSGDGRVLWTEGMFPSGPLEVAPGRARVVVHTTTSIDVLDMADGTLRATWPTAGAWMSRAVWLDANSLLMTTVTDEGTVFARCTDDFSACDSVDLGPTTHRDIVLPS